MPKKAEKANTEVKYTTKGLSAFFFFANEHRPRLLEESLTKGNKNGKKDVGYAMGQIGILWKNVSAEDKAKYDKMAEKDKLRYQKDLKDGMVNKPRKVKKDKKKKKDPNAPTRPMSGYMQWMNDERQNIIAKFKFEKSQVKEVLKKAGELWKAVDDATKAKYNEPATKAMAAWKIENEQYKAATAGGADEESGDDSE